MAPGVQETARIFEDPEPVKPRKGHKRVPSVADVLRGRRKENSPTKIEQITRRDQVSPSPLGERSINSPPQPKMVPLKDEPTRPPMHKKTGSSVSLKSLMGGGKSKTSESVAISPTESKSEAKPKKVRSATNLVGLLKKKSKKDMKDEANNLENIAPIIPPSTYTTPIWAEFTSQSSSSSYHFPANQPSSTRSIEQEIDLYTPKDFSEFRPAEQRNFGTGMPTLDYKPPQRPFLEHKSSRSSIFTENLDEDEPVVSRPKSRDASAPPSPSKGDNFIFPALRKPSPETIGSKPKRSSRVLDTISAFNLRSRPEAPATPKTFQSEAPLSPQEVDTAFEKVLDTLNIPLNMRDGMRNLKPEVKAGLMKGDRVGSGSSMASSNTEDKEVRSTARSKKENDRPKSKDGEEKDSKRDRSRPRSRSRILTLTRRDDQSQPKQEKAESSTRSRSKSRPKSIDLTRERPLSARSVASNASIASFANNTDSTSTPGDFIHYLREVQKPALVEVGKIHKLRILLRNESVAWTDIFVTNGGMDELIQLLYRILKIEWREEHEDNLLHETLLCLKALSTTSLALQRLKAVENEIFPTLLTMLFDPERRGPSEFNTRGLVTSLLFAHLSAVPRDDSDQIEERTRRILGYLKDQTPDNGKQPLEFVSQMYTSRPYRTWAKEVVNVTKEVFWIFLHHLNVVPIVDMTESGSKTFAQAYFPAPRPPQPAAPYVGGVEWEATQYLATHLDLLNGLIAGLPSAGERNQLREELRQSGWEKAMGGSLRTCKEKFYSGVHDGLRVWVAAAKSDGWTIEDVRAGPPREASSPRKSPVKKRGDDAPKLMLDVEVKPLVKQHDGWL